MMNLFVFMSESNLEEDGFDSDVSMTLLNTQQNMSYTLDLQSIRTAQLHDFSLMPLVEKRIANRVISNINYTYKSVQGVELIHENNRILAPESK